MKLIGEDFRKGLRGWQYPDQPMQSLWRGLGLFVLLLIVFEILMVPLLGAVITHFGFGVAFHDFVGGNGPSADLMQGYLVSMFPSMILLCVLTWALVPRGLAGGQGRLPLAWPRLGLLGWLAIVIGFLLIVTVMMNVIFAATGHDPGTTKGLIEQSMEEIARNKVRYAFMVPGVALGAPIAEELLFRGFLFAALAPTRVGKWGAVLVSAALWSLAHAGPAPWVIVAGIFVMGLVLGVLLLRFGSLWVTIVLHIIWNAIQSFGLYALGNQ